MPYGHQVIFAQCRAAPLDAAVVWVAKPPDKRLDGCPRTVVNCSMVGDDLCWAPPWLGEWGGVVRAPMRLCTLSLKLEPNRYRVGLVVDHMGQRAVSKAELWAQLSPMPAMALAGVIGTSNPRLLPHRRQILGLEELNEERGMW